MSDHDPYLKAIKGAIRKSKIEDIWFRLASLDGLKSAVGAAIALPRLSKVFKLQPAPPPAATPVHNRYDAATTKAFFDDGEAQCDYASGIWISGSGR